MAHILAQLLHRQFDVASGVSSQRSGVLTLLSNTVLGSYAALYFPCEVSFYIVVVYLGLSDQIATYWVSINQLDTKRLFSRVRDERL